MISMNASAAIKAKVLAFIAGILNKPKETQGQERGRSLSVVENSRLDGQVRPGRIRRREKLFVALKEC